MITTKLSANGYQLTDIFESELLAELVALADSFEANQIRPHPDSRREVCYPSGTVSDKIIDAVRGVIAQVTPEMNRICAVEIWRDYPGYTNTQHIDDVTAQNVIIAYLDGRGEEGMGTFYIENERYLVPYIKNSGLLLLNSDKIAHGMMDTVTATDYRRALYINWIDSERNLLLQTLRNTGKLI